MRATQIYLPEDLAVALDRLARQRGTSRAELLRQAARQMVDSEPSYQDDPLWGIVGLVDDAPNESAADHDRHLADAEVARWRR